MQMEEPSTIGYVNVGLIQLRAIFHLPGVKDKSTLTMLRLMSLTELKAL